MDPNSIFRAFFGDDDDDDNLNNGGFPAMPHRHPLSGWSRSFSSSSSYSMQQDDEGLKILMDLPGFKSSQVTVEVTKPDNNNNNTQSDVSTFVPPSKACVVDITADPQDYSSTTSSPSLSLSQAVTSQPRFSLRPSRETPSPQQNNNNSQQQQQQTSRPPVRQRFRLGPSVDCETVAANLSRGILKITADKKAPPKIPPMSTRVIDVTENDYEN